MAARPGRRARRRRTGPARRPARDLRPRRQGAPRRPRRAGTARTQRRRADARRQLVGGEARSEEHTSELQSLMRISYAVFCLKKKKTEMYNKTTNDMQLYLN